MSDEPKLTPEQFEKVKEVFDQADDLDEDSQEAFLDEACEGAPDVRAEVERLLSQETGVDLLDRIRSAAASALSRRRELALSPGESLGDYEVLAPLGAGGMGEVYRAQDHKLGREVALKVMVEAPSIQSDRYPRFAKEARLLASLNHPNIATLHGLDNSDGLHFLVMELVEGETLAERIAKGRVPVKEALSFFRQVAAAMEVAHGKGVLHRDLKPANIKLTPDGTAKVLDFSLATAFGVEDGHEPTETRADLPKEHTDDGVILGTAAYMSPEQARGEALDRRTDTWAFGCCLYEALTGRQAFAGKTVPETLAAVLTAEPVFHRLPAETPISVRRLLRRCLEKDPQRRLRDFGDALLDLEDGEAPEPARARHAVTVAAALTLAALTWALTRWTADAVDPSGVTRLSIALPAGMSLPASTGPLLDISPDGRRLAVTADRDGVRQIFARELESDSFTPIVGSEGGRNATLSPDGTEIVFRRDFEFCRVSIDGGPVLPLTSGDGDYASWGPDDKLYYRDLDYAIARVPARGGQPEVVLEAVSGTLGGAINRPEVLPSGEGVLFTLWRGGDPSEATVEVLSLRTGRHRTLIEGGTMPKYVASGHIVYALDHTLFAAPFDAERLELLGPSVPVVEDVQIEPAGAVHFDVSDNGTLIYARTRAFATSRLVLVDREGKARALGDARGNILSPRVSADGSRVALESRDEGSHIWIYERDRDVLTRMTSRGSNSLAVWNPTGEKLAYRSWREEAWRVFVVTANDPSEQERITQARRMLTPETWLPDSSGILLTTENERGDTDIVLCRLEEDASIEPVASTSAHELQPALSPNGRLLAYVSDEIGERNIWVAPFPEMRPKRRVSTDGGEEPVWSRDGRELYYRDGRRMMAVAFDQPGLPEPGRPLLLFEGDYRTDTRDVRSTNYDVTPDGEFLMLVADEHQDARIEVVSNWFEELRERAPAR